MPRHQSSRFAGTITAWLVCVALAAMPARLPWESAAALARDGQDSFDPFARMSQGNWVSPDKFEKAPPQFAPPSPVPNEQEPPKVLPNHEPTSSQPLQSAQPKEGFGVEINSTAEALKLPVPLPPAKVGERPPRRYEPGWMQPTSLARRQAFVESAKGWSPYGGVASASSPSLRLSYLPGKIPPLGIPGDKGPQITPPQPAKSPHAEAQAPDLETWTKAIKDYKTKQMEAIQSDRQTLEALQNAIKELGLQQEINFNSSLMLSPPKQEAPPSNPKDGAKRSQN